MYHPRDKEKEAKGRHGATMPTKPSQFMVSQQQKQETQKISRHCHKRYHIGMTHHSRNRNHARISTWKKKHKNL
jgi:hypothetical protein